MNPAPSAPRARTRLKDIAQAANVSVATASMAMANHPAIKDQTKHRIWQISRRLGYHKPGVAVQQQVSRLGVVMIQSRRPEPVRPSFFFDVLADSFDPSLRFEYATIDGSLPQSQIIEQALAFSQGLDGLVLSSIVHESLIAALRHERIPHVVSGYVATDDPLERSRVPAFTLAYDALAMGRLATRFLMARGHKNIAFICETMPPQFQHDHWLRGFRLAHAEQGILPDPRLIAVAGSTPGAVDAVVRRWLDDGPRPDALLLPELSVVPTVLSLFAERGIVLPADAVIISCIDAVAQRLNLDQYPRVVGRTDLLVRRVVELLRRVVAEPDLEPYAVHLPFVTHHMDDQP